MLKPLIQRLLRGMGLELRRIEAESPSTQYGLLPPWIGTRPELPGDGADTATDLSPEPLANRTYRSAHLAYHRTEYGDDQRLKYILYFLDLRDQRVLEIGPLYATHSFMLEKLGVRETVAVEAREANLAECLRIQEKYGLEQTTFVLQDIEKLSNGEEEPLFSGPFDLVFCCGALYHLGDPAQALRWFREQAPVLFLGTHYVEKMALAMYTPPCFHFDRPYKDQGRDYAGAWFKEGGVDDPFSGMSPYSFWPFERDLLAMVREAGYTKVSVLGKDLQNNLPHITLLAEV